MNEPRLFVVIRTKPPKRVEVLEFDTEEGARAYADTMFALGEYDFVCISNEKGALEWYEGMTKEGARFPGTRRKV